LRGWGEREGVEWVVREEVGAWGRKKDKKCNKINFKNRFFISLIQHYDSFFLLLFFFLSRLDLV
jgi:hypothetical protein